MIVAAALIGLAIVIAGGVVALKLDRSLRATKARLTTLHNQNRHAEAALSRIAKGSVPDPTIEAQLALDYIDTLENR